MPFLTVPAPAGYEVGTKIAYGPAGQLTLVTNTTPLPSVIRDSSGNEIQWVTERAITVFRKVNTADANNIAVKNAAGWVYGLYFINEATAVRWVHLFDNTDGSGTPLASFGLPAVSAGGAGVAGAPFFVDPIPFTTGISMKITTARDATGAPAANDVTVNVFRN